MKHEAAKLAHQTSQGTEARNAPGDLTQPQDDEQSWEEFCSWHISTWGWKPSKTQRTAIWSAYQAGVTLALEAQTAPAPSASPAPAPVRAYDPIWPKFVLYYKSFGRGSPEREDLDNPLMDVQEHYNLFLVEYHAKREALRDAYAGQAMQGLLSRYPAGAAIDYTDLAHRAYNMAREMMRIRDKPLNNI